MGRNTIEASKKHEAEAASYGGYQKFHQILEYTFARASTQVLQLNLVTFSGKLLWRTLGTAFDKKRSEQ